MTGVRFSIHNDPPTGLIDQWGVLWERDPNATPNSQPDRFLNLVRAMNATPAIIEINSPDDGVGLIIARIESRSLTRSLGYFSIRTPRVRSLMVTYGGFLGNVSAYSALECLCDLLRSGKVDHVFLNHLQIDTPLFSALRNQPKTVEHASEPHWKLKLDESFEKTMQRHSNRTRSKLRQEARNLARSFGNDLAFLTFEDANDLERALTEANSISRKTYHAKLGGLVECSPIWSALLSSAAEKGDFRAHFVTGRGQPLAFVLGMNEKHKFHALATAYLPEHSQYSPGKHAWLYAIERACKDGLAWVDYGCGDAEYKRIYGTHSSQEASVNIYGNTFRANITWIIDMVTLWIDNKLRRILGFRLAQRVKRTWRRWLSARAK